MRGRRRIRRKHLKQAGWEIVEEGKATGQAYRLVLQSPAGEQVNIEAARRPRAYVHGAHVAIHGWRRGRRAVVLPDRAASPIGSATTAFEIRRRQLQGREASPSQGT